MTWSDGRTHEADKGVSKLDGLVGLDAEIEARSAFGGGRGRAAEPLEDQRCGASRRCSDARSTPQIAADVEVVDGSAEPPGTGRRATIPGRTGYRRPGHLAGEIEGRRCRHAS